MRSLIDFSPESRLNENSVVPNNIEMEKNSVSHFVDTVCVFFPCKSDRRRQRCQPASNRSACLPAAARLAPIAVARAGTCLMIGKIRISLLYCYCIMCISVLCRCPRINLNFFS